jgi:hypothetical protein
MALADRRPARITTAEVWRRAREAYPPGARLVRIIRLDLGEQRFDEIPETEQNFLDGATHVLPCPPGGHSYREWDAMIALYNAKFMGLEP